VVTFFNPIYSINRQPCFVNRGLAYIGRCLAPLRGGSPRRCDGLCFGFIVSWQNPFSSSGYGNKICFN